MPSIAVLIVAAGRGERAGGGLPKQYQALGGVPMLRRSVNCFAHLPDIGKIQVVIGPDQEKAAGNALAGLTCAPFVTGGATRQDSVRNGLEALAAHQPDFVLIHDAARPLVSAALIGRVVEALGSGAVAAVPLLPVIDTLKTQDGGSWKTVPREGLLRAQTPQGFRFDALLQAHRRFAERAVTDDMAIAELAGLAVTAVPGEETNMKVTTADDFALAEKLLGNAAEFRTGQGFDAHRFTAGDHVWLCGVRIPHDCGLEGHSDADAGLHALTDAILGTIGAGDIGVHFPPADERWRGADSSQFLAHAAGLVAAAGGSIAHCDVTLLCERPKIGLHREAMRARIAAILGLEIGRVSVKATTTEGMGFTGRREGLAAQAVATVRFVPR
ncbi:MAG TPA: bifunctional 2-C-methyl-D-erythritol 4-phosphate cytidylyltransferase/2-C-methyl-D-erythritol 2,4-cyclodiphosphate synthase [Rhizomicrobium sp.]|jgi:2-C-methyl-D-erythritol 4-phosphate cytidylyltransferase/2-C-methyl-D-erythritol 2,4-cyclodiphosphate synthase